LDSSDKKTELKYHKTLFYSSSADYIGTGSGMSAGGKL